MAKHTLKATWGKSGYAFSLQRASLIGRASPVPLEQWQEADHPAVGLLQLLHANDGASPLETGLLVEHETVASMSMAEICTLGLPGPCPYHLRLETRQAISDPEFGIRVAWLDRGVGEVAGLQLEGACLRSSVESYTLLEPLFSLVREIQELNALPKAIDQASLDRRMAQFQRVKLALSTATGRADADSYLDRLLIYHATGLGIDAIGALGQERFEPTLYGTVPAKPGEDDNEDREPNRKPLLAADLASVFRERLFRAQGARTHYTLSGRRADGSVFVVLDRPVEAALRVVERMNRADAETRSSFRADPRSFLVAEMEAAGGGGDVLCGGTLLEQAHDYGERVLGVEEWGERTFSFKLPVYRKWFPDEQVEVFTIELPGSNRPLVVEAKDVDKLRDAIERAEKDAHCSTTFNGARVPITAEVKNDVGALSGFVRPAAASRSASVATRPKPRLLVLRVAGNEEDLLYNARLRDPGGLLADSAGHSELLTKPKPHQKIGISWLKQAYLEGMPGVLLADDMGVGKTLQVLAFLSWLRATRSRERAPVLVVAPQKLLKNWLKEIRTHVGLEGIGRPCLAYDRHLQSLKTTVAKEGQVGRHVLDVSKLEAHDWVLTTYESLRDYHFSFAKVRFSVAVYDEAQKLKSMASLMNNAAKSQQPEFTVLMTGTPIENSVLDLWTLLDVAWPGFLGMSAKDFSKTYGPESDEERLRELKDKLVKPTVVGGHTCRPVMLRRFKTDVVEGLPKKTSKIVEEVMGAEQARKYDAVLADVTARRWHPLKALQALRYVCLHPDLRVPTSAREHDEIIQESARFRALFRILDDLKRREERALIFVDFKKAQDVLCHLIRSRYELKRAPDVINGETAPDNVDKIVERFQQERRFDTMLLGPRSAGFGLNLTNATHVVHLNRWWNPAVEDQCSDRAFRIGQTKDVTIHLPLAVHPRLGGESFDMILNALLEQKRRLSQEIVVPTMITEDEARELFARLSGHTPIAQDAFSELDRMDWDRFQNWVADQFRAEGYQAHSTPRTGDGGADVILRAPRGKRAIICQCKHKSRGGGVDETAIRDVLRARGSYSQSTPGLEIQSFGSSRTAIWSMPPPSWLKNEASTQLIGPEFSIFAGKYREVCLPEQG